MKLFLNLLFILTLFAREASSKELKKFTIFSGDKKASYYAVASGICNVFNRYYSNQGFECVARESAGSEKNLSFLANGEADIAVIKSPEFNQFFIKNSQDLQNKTNFIANIHDEYLTILVQKKLKIKSISDLVGKVVNIGNIGSTSDLIIAKYFSDFEIKPKEIVNFGAEKSFQMLCDKKIDAWIYFIGHPNRGYQEALEKCDLELVSLSQKEVSNFLNDAPFLEKTNFPKNYYESLKSDLKTISSKTILASRKNLDPKISYLVKDILINRKEELTKESVIFAGF
jgi:TRAP transporter TAXI family solute receptor